MTILSDIINGNHDTQLNEIRDALNARDDIVRSTKSANAMASIKVGDVITLSGLSGKGVNGYPCKVVKKNKTRIVVKFVDAGHKYHPTVSFTVPASCCTLIGGE